MGQMMRWTLGETVRQQFFIICLPLFRATVTSLLCVWMARTLLFSQVKLFLQRLTGDWDRQPVELRKTWSLKDAQSLHGACGFFLHVMGELESQVARSDFDDCKDAILSQFMTGFSDPEIDHLLQTTVPPVELRDISFLKRPVCFSLSFYVCQVFVVIQNRYRWLCALWIQARNVVVAFEARTQKEVEAKEAEAAARVAEATLEHLKVKLNKDLEVLRARVSTPEHEAHEALKDQAYLRDRQQKLSPDQS